jgi:4'-phosphopantetheinyl transferase
VVTCATVPQGDEEILRLGTFLSRDERAKADRFAFARDRRRFVTAHALLRFALWQETGASDAKFVIGAYGKPELDPPYGSPRLRFNLSHSGTLAVCGVCYGHDIGVDTERVDAHFAFDDIAARYFTPNEQAQIASAQGSDRLAAFWRIWTMKEAVLKAVGRGLSAPLTDFEISLNPLALRCPPGEAKHSEKWHIEQRSVCAQHWTAIAVRHPSDVAIDTEWRRVTTAEITNSLAL